AVEDRRHHVLGAARAQQLAERLARELVAAEAQRALPCRGEQLERAVEARLRQQHLRPLVGIAGRDVDDQVEVGRRLQAASVAHASTIFPPPHSICTASYIESICPVGRSRQGALQTQIGLRPVMILTRTTTTAITSRAWMKPPRV